MSRNVFLHVGLPKSGTSYLQKTLTANKDDLERAGLLFPGRAWVDQVRAVQDVRQMPLGPAKRKRVAGAWHRLVAEIAAWPDDALISMEWLSPASPERIRVMVEDLRPARVQVIFTARDLARTVPAAWQEFMQNRDEWTWPEFLESVVSGDASPGSPGARFWAQQDLAALLRSWTEVLPLEDVHVVTLPHPGAAPDVLWERLCQVLGRSYPHGRPAAGSNSSLGMESAEMMRRLNRLAREDGLPTALYQKAFKHELAKGVLAERTRAESRLVLPPEHHEWARREAARQIEAVRASGVHVVGDLAELEPVLDASPGPQPQDVADAALLDIALAGLVSMARRWGPATDSAGRLRTENERLRARVEHFERHPARAALGRYARAARTRASALRRPRG
jgi:hypothetical protein